MSLTNQTLAAPHRLQTDLQTNPLGLGMATPNLSWEVRDERQGARQSAWQVQIAADESSLASEKNLRWDSGQVSDDRSHLVPWGAEPLVSRERVYWRVRTWDADGKPSPWSAAAWCEAGLLARSDWQAQWIHTDLYGSPLSGTAAPNLRRSVVIKGAIKRARLYITALGLVVPTINGQRVGNQELAPGWQDFRYRVRYQTIDVTDVLQPGENVIGAVLGDGWYCGHIANFGRQHYGDRPHLLAQLEIEDDAGRTIVGSDEAWRWATGANIENDLVMGQSDDLTREAAGWNRPGFNDAEWKSVRIAADPGIAIEAETGRGIVREQELAPIAAPKTEGAWNNKRWIVDFGQNLVGRVRLMLTLSKKTTIVLRFGEMLDAEGKLYVENLRSATCTDVLTAPAGELDYEHLLTCHGFRFMEITAPLDDFTADNVRAVVLGAGLTTMGGFACSDELVNKLQSNIEWGLRGNFLEVPTDCPQRDERLGWTGDAQVFVATAVYNRDVSRFMAKWQQDLVDAQMPDGGIPSIAPAPIESMANGEGGPAWSDAMVIVPWTIWKRTGDTRVISQHFERLAKYVDSLAAKSHELIRSHPDKGWGGFGDWLALDGSGKTDGGTPKDLIGTAYLAYDAGLMVEIATALGKDAEAKRFADLQARVTSAFQRRFVTPDGLIAGQTQTAMALALFMDLVPETSRTETARALVRDIESRGVKIATGFVGTPYLLHVLSRFGYDDLAWQLLLRREFPSWLFPVTQGATTIWERWDGWTIDKGFQDKGMNSYNHYAYGAVGQWMYERAAGLGLANGREALGYRRLRIAPAPTERLEHAEAWHRTPYGEARSGWRRAGDVTTVTCTIPPGCSAELVLPAPQARVSGLDNVQDAKDIDGSVHGTLVAGSYTFTIAAAVQAQAQTG